MTWDTPFAEWEGCAQVRQDLTERWGLVIQERLPGATCSQVFACEWQGKACVLKIPNPEVEEAESWRVLESAHGKGLVRPLLIDEDSGSLLMPRLGGCLAESGLTHEEQVMVWVEIAQQIRHVPTKMAVMSAECYLGDLKPVAGPNKQEVICIWEKLHNEPGHRSFLHGDLHHFNILQDGDQWLAIDPKGLVGDAAFEAGAFLRNPIGSGIPAEVSLMRISRIAQGLSLDPKRVWEWGILQLWMNGWGEDEDDFSLSCRDTWQGLWSLRGDRQLFA